MSKKRRKFHINFTNKKFIDLEQKRDARAKHEAPHDKGEGKS